MSYWLLELRSGSKGSNQFHVVRRGEMEILRWLPSVCLANTINTNLGMMYVSCTWMESIPVRRKMKGRRIISAQQQGYWIKLMHLEEDDIHQSLIRLLSMFPFRILPYNLSVSLFNLWWFRRGSIGCHGVRDQTCVNESFTHSQGESTYYRRLVLNSWNTKAHNALLLQCPKPYSCHFTGE